MPSITITPVIRMVLIMEAFSGAVDGVITIPPSGEFQA
jgi:hypothetical protein